MNIAKKQKKTIEWERLDIFLNKIRDIKGIFHAKMGLIKDRNDKDITEQKRLRSGRKNTQKNDTRKVLMTWVTKMIWSLT